MPLAATDTCPFAADAAPRRRPVYGLQFHPEVTHTPHGAQIFAQLPLRRLRLPRHWTIGRLRRRDRSRDIRAQVGDGRVICGLSGGVDSSVVAALLHKAIGDQLTCIFVDNGLLRKDEAERGRRRRSAITSRSTCTSSTRRTSSWHSSGRRRPTRRRSGAIIGHEFIDVFERRGAQASPALEFLAQGTLYPDVIESGATARRPGRERSSCTTTSAACRRTGASS